MSLFKKIYVKGSWTTAHKRIYKIYDMRSKHPYNTIHWKGEDDRDKVLDTFYSALDNAKKKRTPIDIAREEAQLSILEASKDIPREMLAEVWKAHFGYSTQGSCFSCKKPLDVFSWEAGYVVAHARGGKKTADNLRPVCVSCNRSMGTENMDAFKARCYPN